MIVLYVPLEVCYADYMKYCIYSPKMFDTKQAPDKHR